MHGAAPREAAAAKLIGLVPQAPALLPWLSVLKNVTLPQKVNPGASKRRARFGALGNGRPPADMLELLRKVGLGEVAHKLPAQLSGGMAQRAAIVRALGLRPDVLLMDEPFSALDELTRESLQDQLLDLWGELKTTVLFVTHSIAEAVRMSDVVVVMGPPGRVLESVPDRAAPPAGPAAARTTRASTATRTRSGARCAAPGARRMPRSVPASPRRADRAVASCARRCGCRWS